eukprot:11946090-Karenia_brevis.AAC.1
MIRCNHPAPSTPMRLNRLASLRTSHRPPETQVQARLGKSSKSRQVQASPKSATLKDNSRQV